MIILSVDDVKKLNIHELSGILKEEEGILQKCAIELFGNSEQPLDKKQLLELISNFNVSLTINENRYWIIKTNNINN